MNKLSLAQKKSILSVSLSFCCVIILIASTVYSTRLITELRTDNTIKNVMLEMYQTYIDDNDIGLVDPTYSELIVFLFVDETNQQLFIKGSYVCSDFARDLMVNASRFNIRSAYVEVFYGGLGPGHAMVAFNTSDQRVVFVEPQSDDIVDLSIGYVDDDRVVKAFYVTWIDNVV